MIDNDEILPISSISVILKGGVKLFGVLKAV
jgi:hypothetical protein